MSEEIVVQSQPQGVETPPRLANGQFRKGYSGNPNGAQQRAIAQTRAKLAEHSEEVIAVVIKAAKAGDLTACRLVLERIAPALRAEPAPISMAPLPATATYTERAQHILDAVTRGDLTTQQGGELINALGSIANLKQVTELQAKIEQLIAQLERRR